MVGDQASRGCVEARERPVPSFLPEVNLATQCKVVTLDEVQKHEAATNANARLGSYEMDLSCPIHEIRCFHVLLDSDDTQRLFVLPDFRKHTARCSCRLVDAMPSAANVAMERLPPGAISLLDLRVHSGLELVLVATDLSVAPLIIVDGNHRALAHYMRFRNLDRVPAYIGVHPNMHQWRFVPRLARIKGRSRCTGDI
jgi:hypothetical protein